jgi:hypothetical protein
VVFGRDRQAARSWSLWLDRHREELVRCGIADFLYSDERRWIRFLEADGWDAETAWRVDMLTPQQPGDLRDLVIRNYGPDSYRGLTRVLRVVMGESSCLEPGRGVPDRDGNRDGRPAIERDGVPH